MDDNATVVLAVVEDGLEITSALFVLVYDFSCDAIIEVHISCFDLCLY